MRYRLLDLLVCLLLLLGLVPAAAQTIAPNVALGNGGQTITGNYAIQPTDCGKALALGNGFYTIAVPSPAGVSQPCSIYLPNPDPTRGKAISGLSGTSIIYPGQALTLHLLPGANSWTVETQPSRYRVTSLVVYIDKDQGSDFNDCLAPGTGACATSRQAMLNISQNIENYGKITIQYGCAATPCIYANLPFIGTAYTGPGIMIVQGDPTTPDNVVLSCATACGSGVIELFTNQNQQINGTWSIQGFKLTATASTVNGLFVASPGLTVSTGNMDFGSTNAGAAVACLYAADVRIGVLGNYTISGGGTNFASATDGCVIHAEGVGTVTGTPAFTQFLFAHGSSIIGTTAASFSGAATGVRCVAELLGLIDTRGTSASLPGDSPCRPERGGVVN